mmetsp:Transcript_338/g.944  ORF Transcript_338/g.944 Transcript_338/m.944 type:complete len:218 (+) Transcript_338:302-955(+)
MAIGAHRLRHIREPRGEPLQGGGGHVHLPGRFGGSPHGDVAEGDDGLRARAERVHLLVSLGRRSTREEHQLRVQRLDRRLDERREAALQRGRQQAEVGLRLLDCRRLGGEERQPLERLEEFGQLELRPPLTPLLPPRRGDVHQLGDGERVLQRLAALEGVGAARGEPVRQERRRVLAKLSKARLACRHLRGVELCRHCARGRVEPRRLDDLCGDLGD